MGERPGLPFVPEACAGVDRGELAVVVPGGDDAGLGVAGGELAGLVAGGDVTEGAFAVRVARFQWSPSSAPPLPFTRFTKMRNVTSSGGPEGAVHVQRHVWPELPWSPVELCLTTGSPAEVVSKRYHADWPGVMANVPAEACAKKPPLFPTGDCTTSVVEDTESSYALPASYVAGIPWTVICVPELGLPPPWQVQPSLDRTVLVGGPDENAAAETSHPLNTKRAQSASRSRTSRGCRPASSTYWM